MHIVGKLLLTAFSTTMSCFSFESREDFGVTADYSSEPMQDMFIFETSHNLEQLESLILASEKSESYAPDDINEIFRIMHTIKGSSAMMLFNNISVLAHSLEDLFYFIREQNPAGYDCSTLSDIVLEGVDFTKTELEKVKRGDPVDGDPGSLIEKCRAYLEKLQKTTQACKKEHAPKPDIKQQYYIGPGKSDEASAKNCYKAVIWFEDGCEMENIRAYSVIHSLKEFAQDIVFTPPDILENDDSKTVIRESGFTVYIRTEKSYEEMHDFFMGTIFLKDLELTVVDSGDIFKQTDIGAESPKASPKARQEGGGKVKDSSEQSSGQQSMISVNVKKLDRLMDLVGELVISEAMVTQNPELKGLVLEDFQRASGQLHKITEEIQDMVMAIRMVPLSTTFYKMNRVVRDMSKKLGRNTKLQIIGEETEVDKNIIEHISDPIMHLVRNAIDHGIEEPCERMRQGKPGTGTITLEAKNAGSDVLIIVRDDGRGLNKEAIIKKAMDNGLLNRPANDMTDREIYNLIFLPGFSTREDVSEFSGRGVGMDVVISNIESIGGSVSVESKEGAGTSVILKIPLTVAIIDGMIMRVGRSSFTMPTTSIRESFRPSQKDIITDPDNREMIMVRGNCYPILRLHRFYGIPDHLENFTEGIFIMVEHDGKTLCIFADELIGQQQVVVKSLPDYIRKRKRKIKGIAGCTLLGDGSISLILDAADMIESAKVYS
jgi:two-component system chemotaxis sensor kinase CheA